jgi:hypothetical protein
MQVVFCSLKIKNGNPDANFYALVVRVFFVLETVFLFLEIIEIFFNTFYIFLGEHIVVVPTPLFKSKYIGWFSWWVSIKPI